MANAARNKYYINNEDVDCVRQGVSAFLRHALVPHESYQAIYASGKADEIFAGLSEKHCIGQQILRSM